MQLMQLERVTRRWWWHQKIQTYSCFAWRLSASSRHPRMPNVERTTTRTRYIGISSVVEDVGRELSKCLIGMHAFTGCDTVSVYAGRGKITVLRLVKQQTSYHEMFKQLGMEWAPSDMLFQSLQEFTCKLFCSQPGTDNINELRYRSFSVE